MTCCDINGSEGLGEGSCVDTDCCLARWVVHTHTHLADDESDDDNSDDDESDYDDSYADKSDEDNCDDTSTILLSTMSEIECHFPRLCSVTCSNLIVIINMIVIIVVVVY